MADGKFRSMPGGPAMPPPESEADDEF